jgi:hypothetical protein
MKLELFDSISCRLLGRGCIGVAVPQPGTSDGEAGQPAESQGSHA